MWSCVAKRALCTRGRGNIYFFIHLALHELVRSIIIDNSVMRPLDSLSFHIYIREVNYPDVWVSRCVRFATDDVTLHAFIVTDSNNTCLFQVHDSYIYQYTFGGLAWEGPSFCWATQMAWREQVQYHYSWSPIIHYVAPSSHASSPCCK